MFLYNFFLSCSPNIIHFAMIRVVKSNNVNNFPQLEVRLPINKKLDGLYLSFQFFSPTSQSNYRHTLHLISLQHNLHIMIALDNLFYILDLRMVAPSKKIELIIYSEWSLHDEGIVEERISYILDHYFRIDESRFLCCFEIKFMQFDLRSDFGYEIVNEVSECCF